MAYRDEYQDVQREVIWTLPRVTGVIVLVMVAMFALGFIATGGDLLTYKFWAPKQENARRQVFEQTQSYVQGKVEYITRLRYQYAGADGAQKSALRTLILDEASTIDNSKLPPDLQAFIDTLK
jgi:hypothetical protein